MSLLSRQILKAEIERKEKKKLFELLFLLLLFCLCCLFRDLYQVREEEEAALACLRGLKVKPCVCVCVCHALE